MTTRFKKLFQNEQTRRAISLGLAAMFSLSAFSLAAFAAPAGKQVRPRPVPTRSYSLPQDLIMVMPNAKSDEDGMKQAFKDVHGTVIGAIGRGPLQVLLVRAEKGKAIETVKKMKADRKHFAAVSFNKRVNSDHVSTDPESSKAWHLPFMNIERAWDLDRGTLAQYGQRSRVAILDSGCSWQSDIGVTASWGADATANKDIGEKFEDEIDGFLGTGIGGEDVEDLQKEMERWANRAETLTMGIYDNNGHGTHAACCVGARENGKAAVGVAPGVPLVPIRVADGAAGAIISAEEYALIAGMIIAIDKNAGIVNISYGSGGLCDPDEHEVLHELFKFFYYKKNGLIFVSAGNEGVRVPYKDCVYVNCISALKQTSSVDGAPAPLELVSFKDTKNKWASNSGVCVDFCAPGRGIPVTDPDGTPTTVSGTSFSTPIVAGVAALIQSANPKLTNRQIETILVRSCRGVSGGRSVEFGFGMPDAEKAVRLARSM